MDLEKYHKFSVFRSFFFHAFRYSFYIWYIALPYQDTDKFKFSLDPLIFHKVMALGLRKISQILSSFVLSDIHFIFGTLLCHTEIQIKFEFGFDSLIFLEVMAQWT
jgi:hypothetical protein